MMRSRSVRTTRAVGMDMMPVFYAAALTLQFANTYTAHNLPATINESVGGVFSAWARRANQAAEPEKSS